MAATLMLEEIIDIDSLNALFERSNFTERRAIATQFASRINAFLEEQGICRFKENFSDTAKFDTQELEKNGYLKLGEMLGEQQVQEALDHFYSTPCFNAHLVAKSDGIGRTHKTGAHQYPFGSFRQEDVVAAPHLLELANDPNILATVAEYLGCTPTLYSMNAWWSFPGYSPAGRLGQEFHRDEDDFKNCVLFLYLTEANADTGAHEYIRGTHREDLVKQVLEKTTFPMVEFEKDGKQQKAMVSFDALFSGAGYDGTPVYRALFDEQIDILEEKPGCAFISDPAGLHQGRIPKKEARLLVWIRYGLYQNRAYKNDKLAPVTYNWSDERIPDDKRHRYINRLIVNVE